MKEEIREFRSSLIDIGLIAIVAVVIPLLLNSCSKRVVASPPPNPITAAKNWAFRPVPETPNHFILAVHNDEDLGEALKAMGCGVCIPETVGTLYEVEVIRKENK